MVSGGRGLRGRSAVVPVGAESPLLFATVTAPGGSYHSHHYSVNKCYDSIYSAAQNLNSDWSEGVRCFSQVLIIISKIPHFCPVLHSLHYDV